MYAQGSPPNRFTVSDLPMISRYAGTRWAGLDDDVKTDVVSLIKDTIKSNDTTTADKLRAAKLAQQIDSLNLKHEMFYTPKVEMSWDSLTPEQLENELQLLDNELEMLELVEVLSLPDSSPPPDAQILADPEPDEERLGFVGEHRRVWSRSTGSVRVKKV